MHFLVEGNLEKKPSVVFLSLQFSTFSNINLEKVNRIQTKIQIGTFMFNAKNSFY